MGLVDRARAGVRISGSACPGHTEQRSEGSMPKPKLPQLTFARARAEEALGAMRSWVPASFRRSPREAPALLASATAVIAVALVLIRGTPVEVEGVRLAVSGTPVDAWALNLAAEPTPAAPTPTPTPAPSSPPPPPPAVVMADSPLPRTEGIRVVIETAHTLIGRPYSYGAGGPHAFDCSGFTSYVWRAAGLRLPHNSAAQFNSLPRVPVESMQPGDLVFSGSGGVGHVGLYIGGGRMIDAPETGRSVEIEEIRDNVIGAARPALLLPAD